MIDITILTCAVCSKLLKECTCKDIDQRLYDFTESLGAIQRAVDKKRISLGTVDRRIDKLLDICQFTELETLRGEKGEFFPWEGFRDKKFKEIEDANKGSESGDSDTKDVSDRLPEG